MRLVITDVDEGFWLQLTGASPRECQALDDLGGSGIRTSGPATDAVLERLIILGREVGCGFSVTWGDRRPLGDGLRS